MVCVGAAGCEEGPGPRHTGWVRGGPCDWLRQPVGGVVQDPVVVQSLVVVGRLESSVEEVGQKAVQVRVVRGVQGLEDVHPSLSLAPTRASSPGRGGTEWPPSRLSTKASSVSRASNPSRGSHRPTFFLVSFITDTPFRRTTRHEFSDMRGCGSRVGGREGSTGNDSLDERQGKKRERRHRAGGQRRDSPEVRGREGLATEGLGRQGRTGLYCPWTSPSSHLHTGASGPGTRHRDGTDNPLTDSVSATVPELVQEGLEVPVVQPLRLSLWSATPFSFLSSPSSPSRLGPGGGVGSRWTLP